MKELKALEILRKQRSYKNEELGGILTHGLRTAFLVYEISEIDEAIAELEAPNTCEWKLEDDLYHGSTVYNFDCGYSYVTLEGSLRENGVNFCPYCGGLAEEKVQ